MGLFDPTIVSAEEHLSGETSHSLDRLDVAFDDHGLTANAGLLLTATLGQHLGLEELFDRHVDLGGHHAGANVARKAMTLVASALVGGDCIDDADALRAGGTGDVLGHRVAAPSTLGTFMRAFTWGHARQMDVVTAEALKRAWSAGAGPGNQPLTMDLDSTICETYGLLKAGAQVHVHPCPRLPPAGRRCFAHRRRLPLEVAGRLRARRSGRFEFPAGDGSARSSSWCGRTADDARRLRLLQPQGGWRLPPFGGEVLDLGQDVLGSQERDRRHSNSDWTPIPYFLEGAEVAETTYTPFASQPGQKPVRLIVRRVRPTLGSQLDLFAVPFSYHAFITDRDGETLALEGDHRRHAEVENTIRDLKYGVGLNHLPSGKFGANAVWLALNVLAHNLARWVSRIGLGEALFTTKRLRFRHLSVPGRLTHSGRRWLLHLPQHWPWADSFNAALERLRLIPLRA